MLLQRSVDRQQPQLPLLSPSSSVFTDDGYDHLLERHYNSDGPQPSVMAGYDHHHDHFDGNHAFISQGTTSWHPMSSGGESMPFEALNPHGNNFASHPAPQYHHHHPSHSAADFAGQEPHWEGRPSYASDHQSDPYSPYNNDPIIKSEDPFPQQVDRVNQRDEPTSAIATEPNSNILSATSPRSETGWMSASSSDQTEKASHQPFKPDHIPFFVDNPPRLRPDGVRKKNARFDIPEDRRVDTIDEFIKAADPKNEPLLKELKQQKRLLRNRQAALDSRCRKKEHTAKLEEERKVLLHQLDSLSEENNQLRGQEAMWLQERASWQAEVARLQMEKEELVQAHTQETANLRRKNNILLEDVQRRHSVPMSVNPSSTGYSSTFSEFDHLSMNDSPTWEEFSLVNHGMPEGETTGTRTTPLPPARSDRIEKEDDKSVGSGLLLMLLLCGAWVASKGSSAVAGMPQMPEDVRAASTAVLDNIYKDAGLSNQAPTDSHSMAIMKGPTSATHQQQPMIQHEFNQHNNPFAYAHSMTAPTLQQQRDDAFSLTSSQYNALTTSDADTFFPPNAQSPLPSTTAKPGRNLHDTLVLSRKGSASEAYTRSLMWDEVPTNVVRDFARMMGERNAQNHNPIN